MLKKVLTVALTLLLFVSLSFAVVGCKKAEEKPAEAPQVEVPAPAAPAAPEAPAAPAAPAPEAPKK